ncbi:50S ribosomal protein L3 [Candidatus Parcubacteria bacterium]|nr:50S ribosomal protein L3 [Patescibacteria group bacterium]MCG2694175.1 50S ribosomal protein L3 [Candidatus Parcubacteria bacterium]
MKFIIGKKLEMSQRFRNNGAVVPVTLIFAPKNQVAQIKTAEKDGYSAIQLGAFPKKKLNKAEKGHLKGLEMHSVLNEFRLDEVKEIEQGQELGVEQFEEGEKVDIIGISKGRGFQGVVKRHGFHGGPASHGHKDQNRMPGSIGSKGVARVFKGMKMGGHMGSDQTTIKNLEIIEVDKNNNILAVKGAVPGARNSLVYIQSK